ncbi:hypothetical protein [Caulobacter sp. S45]|uniref:hypothetical protein n=1 Tax=Caulobacter sp. S45 TaxID=1641861 RepID=UPI00131DA440|nr:hypothetical protein [Caulobacter sp. S45]
MNDKVQQAIFARAALIEAEAAAQALPEGPQRRALIAAHRRLHARLYACLILAEDAVPGITSKVVPDSGGGDKQVDFAEGVGPQAKQAA